MYEYESIQVKKGKDLFLNVLAKVYAKFFRLLFLFYLLLLGTFHKIRLSKMDVDNNFIKDSILELNNSFFLLFYINLLTFFFAKLSLLYYQI